MPVMPTTRARKPASATRRGVPMSRARPSEEARTAVRSTKVSK
jgi:hypothetical protein